MSNELIKSILNLKDLDSKSTLLYKDYNSKKSLISRKVNKERYNLQSILANKDINVIYRLVVWMEYGSKYSGVENRLSDGPFSNSLSHLNFLEEYDVVEIIFDRLEDGLCGLELDLPGHISYGDYVLKSIEDGECFPGITDLFSDEDLFIFEDVIELNLKDFIYVGK